MRRLWFLIATIAMFGLAGCQSASQPTPATTSGATITQEVEANASLDPTLTTGVTTVESEHFSVDIPASLRTMDPAAPVLDEPYQDPILIAKLSAVAKRRVRVFATDFARGQLLAIVELEEGESFATLSREMVDIGALVQSKNRTPAGNQTLYVEVKTINKRRHVVYFFDELYKERPGVITEIEASIKPKD
jgi:hypothetical protein